jgi:aminopeptidase-like protein
MQFVETGYDAFDWTVPKEWNIRGGYIEDKNGNRILDFSDSNVHIMGYSTPIDKTVSLEDLQEHIFSIPELPDAIPYMTSYYKENWAFCMTDSMRQGLKDDQYHVKIDSTLEPGQLDYADLVIPGESSKEVLLSTYICHPSLANNELSGPVLATALARWLSSAPRRYTYRIVFVPETIGSIIYLSKHLEHLKKHVFAGYVLSCVGDDRSYSYMSTPSENTYTDLVAHNALNMLGIEYNHFSFLERGSDERQYCSPNVDLPVGSIMRTKYGDYPEYHTSLDDLNVISAEGLEGAFRVMSEIIGTIENNRTYKSVIPCEPFLSKHDLYPTGTSYLSNAENRDLVNLIAYSDGHRSLLDISDVIEAPVSYLHGLAEMLVEKKLMELVE